MIYDLRHVSGPTVEPLTVEEVAAHVHPSDVAAEAEMLERLIRVARRDAENHLGQKIGVQVWDIVMDSWPWRGYWRIPIEPLISVDSISYIDADGVSQTFAMAGNWQYSSGKHFLWLKSGVGWPSVELQPWAAITVRVTVGMQPVSDGNSPPTSFWPENIRTAMLFRIGTMYALREDVALGTTQAGAEIPMTFRHLLSTERNLMP